MTKEECVRQIIVLVSHHLEDSLLDECRRILGSGGIDLTEHSSGNYILPNAILKVAMENCAAEMEIRKEEGQSIIRYLRQL